MNVTSCILCIVYHVFVRMPKNKMSPSATASPPNLHQKPALKLARCCSSNRMMDWCPPRDARRYAVSPILQEDDDTHMTTARQSHTQPAFVSAAASTCARIALARLLVVDTKLEQQAHNGFEASDARVKQRIPALTAREVEAGGCG